MLRQTALAIAVALFTATHASAGPFGIAMGAKLSDLKVIEKHETTGPLQGYTISVPQPNSEFDVYMVLLTPETGVCKIVALGKTNESDRYGTAVKTAYNRLKAALAQKYGAPREYDFLSNGALWKNSEDFAASLDENERTLASFWTAVDSGGANEVANLTLSAEGIHLSDTYIRLAYELKNFERCAALRDQADNQGL